MALAQAHAVASGWGRPLFLFLPSSSLLSTPVLFLMKMGLLPHKRKNEFSLAQEFPRTEKVLPKNGKAL